MRYQFIHFKVMFERGQAAETWVSERAVHDGNGRRSGCCHRSVSVSVWHSGKMYIYFCWASKARNCRRYHRVSTDWELCQVFKMAKVTHAQNVSAGAQGEELHLCYLNNYCEAYPSLYPPLPGAGCRHSTSFSQASNKHPRVCHTGECFCLVPGSIAADGSSPG